MVDYNAYGETPHQGNVWQAVKDTLAVAGKEVAGLSGTIRVGDFGSSAGSNSCEQLEVLVSAIRKEDEEKPIEVIHMDTLSNNWNDLFKTVSSHRRTYLKYPNTYAFGTAGTFYEQCFPRDSLSISYASMAYHWQEKDCVDGVDDTLFTQLSRDPAVAEAARDQAAREWLRILSLRAEELRAGGHLIALHMGRNRSGVLWDQLDRAWASMANDNKITSDEKRRVMFNVYSRTPEELLAPFQEELKDKLQLVSCERNYIPDKIYEAWKSSGGDKAILMTKYVGLCKGICASGFEKALSTRTEQERQQVLLEFWDRFHRNLMEVELAPLVEVDVDLMHALRTG